MPSWCCVPRCRNRQMHKFPSSSLKHPDRWEKWLAFAREARQQSSWEPSKHSGICSKHFLPEDYHPTLMGERLRLNKAAIPTVLLPENATSIRKSRTSLSTLSSTTVRQSYTGSDNIAVIETKQTCPFPVTAPNVVLTDNIQEEAKTYKVFIFPMALTCGASNLESGIKMKTNSAEVERNVISGMKVLEGSDSGFPVAEKSCVTNVDSDRSTSIKTEPESDPETAGTSITKYLWSHVEVKMKESDNETDESSPLKFPLGADDASVKEERSFTKFETDDSHTLEDNAYAVLPEGWSIVTNKDPDTSGESKRDEGIWTEHFIPKGFLFGPFKPCLTQFHGKSKDNQSGSHSTTEQTGAKRFKTAPEELDGHWMKSIKWRKQPTANMLASISGGKMFLETVEDIQPHTELLFSCADHDKSNDPTNSIVNMLPSLAERTGQGCKKDNSENCEKDGESSEQPSLSVGNQHAESDECHSRTSESVLTNSQTKTKPRPLMVYGQSFNKAKHNLELLGNWTRGHQGEKSYNCDVCGQMFATHSNMLVHMRIHTREKLFSCDKCDQ